MVGLIDEAVSKRDWYKALAIWKSGNGGSFRAFWNRYSTHDADDLKAAKQAYKKLRVDCRVDGLLWIKKSTTKRGQYEVKYDYWKTSGLLNGAVR